MVNNLELPIVQGACCLAILFAFTISAAALLFTLVETYIAVGGGVILPGFGGNRFTASAAEGYFPFVIRVGVRLLFFYLVLAIGVQLASQWNTALATVCKPVPAALPWWTTYGVPLTKIITTVCSGTIPVSVMLDYAGLTLVFAIMTIGVPHTVSSLVGGSIGLAVGWNRKFTCRRREVFLKNLSRYHTASIGAASFDKGKRQLLLAGLVAIVGINENVCIEEATSAHAVPRD